jgi:POT family proton-dependent oligopeptide transporter
MTKDPTSEFASAAAAVAAPGAAVPAAPALPGSTAFFGHPLGLATLFFTEFWERFSYYGMRSLLILFMTAAAVKGGLGFDDLKAGAIYGLYTSFVYLTALPGGWLADRVLGQRRAVFLGGCVIALGHFSMAIPRLPTFYLGLVLIVVGTGLLKPNVSTMVGELYPEGGARRDAGFSIFYMGINLGAFIAPFVCGWLGQRVNWHWGFAAAGFGMVAGVIQYVWGGRYLGVAGLEPNAGDDPAERRKARRLAWGGLAVAVLVVLVVGLGWVHLSAPALASSMGVIILALALASLVFQMFFGGLDALEKKKMAVIFVLFLFSALFWSGFEQAGSSLNLFAERRTDLHVLAWSIPASVLQAVNPLFIILLAPVFAWIWVALARHRRDPSSPAKFALGLILVGLGFLVMAVAAVRTLNGTQQVSPFWLILTYLCHTCGELCLSPVGLSTVTKLAPHRKVSQMMGIWFMSLSLGNLMAGLVAGRFATFPLPLTFGAVCATTAGAGLILLIFVKPLKRLMGEVH